MSISATDRPIKKRRLGPLLAQRAREHHRYNSAHAFLGGTGAVGGAALLQTLSLYEEMFTLVPPADDAVPILLATGRGEEDLEIFTRRFFRIAETRHGRGARPHRLRRAGYLSHSGVFIALERLNVSLLPQLEGAQYLRPEERSVTVRRALEELQAQHGRADEASTPPVKLLSGIISRSRPFSSFLRRYADANLQDYGGRFASVTVGIPLPSLVAYHHQALEVLATEYQELTEDEIVRLKDLFVHALHEDLVSIKGTLADAVLVAHTTGVGGMLDEILETAGQSTRVRLGFAHAAQDEFLAQKHQFAKALGGLYAKSGLLVLVTAAAIGVDEVRIDERVPLHQKVVQQLFDAGHELFPGAKEMQPPESKASRAAGRPVPARHYAHVYRPITLPLAPRPRAAQLQFERGTDLRPRFALRSGENGFFSVANAEALYRVMRVASASELGAVLATVGLFGDDPNVPWFVDGTCNYSETDYARQVFDFLRLPELMESHVGGLEPMALQDLGSSKHQCELHTLGLLILLHRLRTVDLDAIDPYVNVQHFDARRFFLERSRSLTFEDLESWEIETLAEELILLCAADTWSDLLAINAAPSVRGLFPARDEALENLLQLVLQSVWAIPSLGTPIVYSQGGTDFVRTGYFVGPLDLVLEETDSLHSRLASLYLPVRTECSFGEFIDFYFCDRGFLDIRPHAILSTAKSPQAGISGRVSRHLSEESFRAGLAAIDPYSYFTSCGLLAVLYRLRHLYKALTEALIELGTWPEFRWQMPRDGRGHMVVLPGACEAFRMISEGLEKTTGVERLDGIWGYSRRPPIDRGERVLVAARKLQHRG